MFHYSGGTKSDVFIEPNWELIPVIKYRSGSCPLSVIANACGPSIKSESGSSPISHTGNSARNGTGLISSILGSNAKTRSVLNIATNP